MQLKLGEIDESVINCKDDLKRIDEQTKGKAEIRHVRKLEIELEDYATQKELLALKKSLENYTECDTFLTMKRCLDRDLKDINEKF